MSDTQSTLQATYGSAFERAVINVLLHAPAVSANALPLLSSQYFEDDAHALIVEHARVVFERANKVPSSMTIRASVNEAYSIAKGTVKESLQRAIDICESDNTLSDADVDFVRLKLGDFVQRASTREALLRAVELHEKGKNDEAVTLIIKERERISSLLTSAIDDGIEHFDTLTKIKNYMADNKASNNVPYGVPKLDALMRGGLERECLGLFMGPPGRGKTRALVQAGASALAHGCVVVHVTLELKKKDVAMRYDARLTGIPINDIKARPKYHAKHIHRETEALKQMGGALYIQQWGPGEAAMLDVSSYIHRVQDKIGRAVDMLLLDYIDLLKPSRGEDRWEQHGQLAVAAKRLAVTEKLRLWTASQTKVESFSRRNIQLSDGADTVEKARISDVLIGLCQTDAEKRSNKQRLIILKNRLGGNEGKIIDCIVSDATQSIREDFIHTDVRDADEDDY